MVKTCAAELVNNEADKFDELQAIYLEKSGWQDHTFEPSEVDYFRGLMDSYSRPVFRLREDDGLPTPILGAPLEQHEGRYTWRLQSVPSEIKIRAIQASNRFTDDTDYLELRSLIAEAAKGIEENRWRIIEAVQDAESCLDAINRLKAIMP